MIHLKALKARRRRLAGKAGFTLVEILIVLTIIAVLMALVGPVVIRQYEKSKVRNAEIQISSLKNALESMYIEIGRYPTEQEGLALLVQSPGEGVPGWSGPYLSAELPKDPWNMDYVYAPGAEGEPPKIVSYGSDRKEGGDGNAADIAR